MRNSKRATKEFVSTNPKAKTVRRESRGLDSSLRLQMESGCVLNGESPKPVISMYKKFFNMPPASDEMKKNKTHAKSNIEVLPVIAKDSFDFKCIRDCKISASELEQKVGRLSIPCLQKKDVLERLCRQKGLKCNGLSFLNENDEYEVDLILEDAVEKGVHWYLVKWKHYSASNATWEPAENLTSCKEVLEAYHFSKKFHFPQMKNGIIDVCYFEKFVRRIARAKNADIGTLIKLCSLQRHNNLIEYPVSSSTVKNLRKTALAMTKYSKKHLSKIKDDVLNIIEFSKRRALALEKLELWEQEINECNPTAPPLRVVNHFDCEGPPPGFKFISDYIFNIPVKNEALIGCECSQCDAHQEECCPKLAKENFAYTRYGYLKLEPGYPIYECNILCKCGPTCCNRVVQKGQQVKLEIFRTNNSRGWGLRTLERLKRGQFILEYVGEVITSEEAEQRRYDDGESYLFDLDFDYTDCAYTVDAKRYGNAAHFINHSCDPNLHVFAVWINHLDPKLPRLAFFARKDIRCGEELTFDYRMNKETSIMQYSSPPSSPSKKAPEVVKLDGNGVGHFPKRIQCLCGAPNCRGFLF